MEKSNSQPFSPALDEDKSLTEMENRQDPKDLEEEEEEEEDDNQNSNPEEAETS